MDLRFRNQASPETLLCLVLRRLAYPVRLLDLCDEFGHGVNWISAVFNDAVLHLYTRWRTGLAWSPNWLTFERVRAYAEAINTSQGGDIYWGFLDGTARRICRPDWHQEVSYSGYKKGHVFNMQAITTPDGLISSLDGPYPGRMNDARMVRESGLEDHLRRLFEGRPPSEWVWLYGDKAYSGKFGIMGAYKRRNIERGLAADLRAYNRTMASMRMAVENGFAMVSNLFQVTNFKMLQKQGRFLEIISLKSALIIS